MERGTSAVIMDGEISNYVDIYKELGHALPPNIVKVYINDMIVAVEPAKQGVRVGEDPVSGIILRMISGRYQKHPKDRNNIGKALDFALGNGVTTNVKKCAVVVCNEGKVNPVTFKWTRRR